MAKNKEVEQELEQTSTEEVVEEQAEEVVDVAALKEENEKLKEEAAKLKEAAQRIQAEFDNYRRRSLADNEQCKVKASAAVVKAILPALDSIDEAIKVYSADETKKEMAEGFDKVHKQIMDSLSTIGVKAMECEGAKFDPNIHEAVLMQECEGKETDEIVTVFRNGYFYKESVIRCAQVIVAK